MQSVRPLLAVRETQMIEVVVSSAWAGDGAVVSSSTDSTAVTLRNIGNFPFEFRVDAGDWARLELRNSIDLGINLSTATIRLRKAEFVGDGLARLEIESLTGGYEVEGNAVNIGGGVDAFTDLTDVPSTYAGKSGQLAFVAAAEDGLEFTNSLLWNASQKLLSVQDLDTGSARFALGTQREAEIIADRATIASSATFDSDHPLVLHDIWCQEVVGEGEEAMTHAHGVTVSVTPDLMDLYFTAEHFQLGGLDVIASDAAAHLTVNAVEYSVAKALRVEINGAAYFLPLFGPVAA